MISVVFQSRYRTLFAIRLLLNDLRVMSLAACLFCMWPGGAHAQPITAMPDTCQTPAVAERIAFLRTELAAREPEDEKRRALITEMMVHNISLNSAIYRQAYDYLQSSMHRREELVYLEGLPPCPHPTTTTTVTTGGPVPQLQPIGGWGSPTPIPPPQGTPQVPPAGQPVTSQYPAPNPFYYMPGTSPPVYNAPFYNAPLVPPPPPVARVFNIPVYNAPWDGGGFYFGPSGSLSVLRDSDLIKHFEPRTSDTFLSMPRTLSGTSSSWLRSSGTGETSPWLRSSDSLRFGSEGGSKTRQLTSSLGYDVGARAGYQFDNFRTEFQFDYANNSVDTFGPNRTFSTDFVMRDRAVSGSTTGMTFLVNGFLDFNVPYLSAYGAKPYVGGGIGAGQTSLDLKVGNRSIVDSSDWGLAYQLGAGLRYNVTPSLSLDIGYRYRAITDVTLRNEFEKITVPNRSHNLEVSLLWKLPWGAAAYPPALAPPPYNPPPPPPPPPSRPGLPVM